MKPSMDSEVVEQEASHWLARRISGAWSEADQGKLDAWLEQRVAHKIAYIRLDAAWAQAGRMRALGAGVPPGVIPTRGEWGHARLFRGAQPETRPPPESELDTPQVDTQRLDTQPGARRPARAKYFALAATLLVFAVGIALYRGGSFSSTGYSTPVGGIETVLLTDGSRITLNTDTRLRVMFTGGERRIQLEKGEAFFEVAKDKHRPFAVYTGMKRVVAVGTKFAVRRDHDDIQVAVTEGRVNLAAADSPGLFDNGVLTGQHADATNGATSPGVLPQSTPPSTFLDAGAIAHTSKAEVLVRPHATQEIEKILSWRGGYVVFDDTALADAVAEFNRYNDRKIVIEDPSIAAIRIGGNFRSNNVNAFLWLLQSGLPVSVQQTDDRIVLKAR